MLSRTLRLTETAVATSTHCPPERLPHTHTTTNFSKETHSAQTERGSANVVSGQAPVATLNYVSIAQEVGLSKDDVTAMVKSWSGNMAACQRAIVEGGGFNWQLFSHAAAPSDKGTKCKSFFRDACAAGSTMQTHATQFGLSVNKALGPGPWSPARNSTPWTLNHEQLDVASFLVARGPWAWLGYGWMGCGCGWENNGEMDCGGYLRPASLDVDYGEPLGLCKEARDGLFVREWSKATVSVDCDTLEPTISMK